MSAPMSFERVPSGATKRAFKHGWFFEHGGAWYMKQPNTEGMPIWLWGRMEGSAPQAVPYRLHDGSVTI